MKPPIQSVTPSQIRRGDTIYMRDDKGQAIILGEAAANPSPVKMQSGGQGHYWHIELTKSSTQRSVNIPPGKLVEISRKPADRRGPAKY